LTIAVKLVQGSSAIYRQRFRELSPILPVGDRIRKGKGFPYQHRRMEKPQQQERKAKNTQKRVPELKNPTRMSPLIKRKGLTRQLARCPTKSRTRACRKEAQAHGGGQDLVTITFLFGFWGKKKRIWKKRKSLYPMFHAENDNKNKKVVGAIPKFIVIPGNLILEREGEKKQRKEVGFMPMFAWRRERVLRSSSNL